MPQLTGRAMLRIGQFEVCLDRREMRSNGQRVRIGSRAFDILELLIQANGELVSKDDIMRRVWPDTIVEENNPHVHIAALRKALADDRDSIRTVPGRGYRLIAPRARVCNSNVAAFVPPDRGPDPGTVLSTLLDMLRTSISTQCITPGNDASSVTGVRILLVPDSD